MSMRERLLTILAGSSVISSEELAFLSGHPLVEVKRAVSSNVKAGEGPITILSSFSDPVIQCNLACHPNSTKGIVEDIISKPYSQNIHLKIALQKPSILKRDVKGMSSFESHIFNKQRNAYQNALNKLMRYKGVPELRQALAKNEYMSEDDLRILYVSFPDDDELMLLLVRNHKTPKSTVKEIVEKITKKLTISEKELKILHAVVSQMEPTGRSNIVEAILKSIANSQVLDSELIDAIVSRYPYAVPYDLSSLTCDSPNEEVLLERLYSLIKNFETPTGIQESAFEKIEGIYDARNGLPDASADTTAIILQKEYLNLYLTISKNPSAPSAVLENVLEKTMEIYEARMKQNGGLTKATDAIDASIEQIFSNIVNHTKLSKQMWNIIKRLLPES